VNVHGSENTSARRTSWEQRAWPAQGVGWFVYDKRGTGDSGGKYTQDFEVLAEDAAAAAREARRLGGARVARLGFDGGSQAGWVIPLAASKVAVDYAVVRYGLAESPLGEDRAETLQGLSEKGYGPEVLTKAGEIIDATGKIMASHYKDGWEDLRAAKARYSARALVQGPEGRVHRRHRPGPRGGGEGHRTAARAGHPVGVRPPCRCCARAKPRSCGCWPAPTARRRSPKPNAGWRPLAAEDPGDQCPGFPATDHGIMEFEQDAEGKRTYTPICRGLLPRPSWTSPAAASSRTAPYGKAARLTR
jgi:hypothetical protein